MTRNQRVYDRLRSLIFASIAAKFLGKRFLEIARDLSPLLLIRLWHTYLLAAFVSTNKFIGIHQSGQTFRYLNTFHSTNHSSYVCKALHNPSSKAIHRNKIRCSIYKPQKTTKEPLRKLRCESHKRRFPCKCCFRFYSGAIKDEPKQLLLESSWSQTDSAAWVLIGRGFTSFRLCHSQHMPIFFVSGISKRKRG